MVKIEVIQGSQKGRVWEFPKDSIQIGRDPGNDLVVEDIHVSSVHCRLLLRGEVWTIEDLGSTNGTGVTRGKERFVLGTGGLASMTIQAGDILLVGSA
ncbi:MAG: FHA domain-containing protein [Deltaproteobacteria bacterium]|nr:FHA domain-containing protein [Deltaproteobacteria bacterium]